jgi:threonine dehydratase
MSGICIGAKGTKPAIKLFGAEPKGADDAARSLEAGHIIPQTNPQTIADGLRTSLGELTFPIIQKYLETIITVEEDEIRHAMKLIWERMKIVTEPSCAVPLAAVLRQDFKDKTKDIKKIGVILGGGNIDFENWKW